MSHLKLILEFNVNTDLIVAGGRIRMARRDISSSNRFHFLYVLLDNTNHILCKVVHLLAISKKVPYKLDNPENILEQEKEQKSGSNRLSNNFLNYYK